MGCVNNLMVSKGILCNTPKQMFKLMDKNIFLILLLKSFLSGLRFMDRWTMGKAHFSHWLAYNFLLRNEK